MPTSINIAEFESVYKEYYVRIYRYAYGFVDDEDVSKDIVSEVFSKLWKNHTQLDKDRLPSLLYVCVRNECMNYLRKQKGMERYKEYCKTAFSEEDDGYLNNMDDRIDEINKVISTMPDKTQFVIEQCCMNHHTYKEVAEMMGITTNGVKKHITKAFGLLRTHFKKT